MQVAVNFVVAHWVATLIAAAAVLVASYGIVMRLALRKHGPQDTAGNGIVVGDPKAFDNRSLALRIERLSAGLAALKIINQNVTQNIAHLQGESSSASTVSLSVGVKTAASKRDEAAPPKKTEPQADAKTAPAESSEATKGSTTPAVALAASDVLSEQLGLASQIVNLQTLYERSLTDRLFNDRSRLQTVLGFQVSITPPAGYENCVAVVEIAVRMKNRTTPVSLVALIPQETTYNSQSISRSARSIEGSAVAQVLSLGLGAKGESRELFVHRDADTIAFERNPRTGPALFKDEPGIVFGWEFRPVLGRTTVAAGTRQMLAVVAVPVEESAKSGDAVLEVMTRTLWRRYNRKKQTSHPRWGWWPANADRSWQVVADKSIDVTIPNTAKIQHALAPKIADIEWVSSGPDLATVIVKGENFFSGTQVVVGDIILSDADGSLTLKSDQALEFVTTIDSLLHGQAVLNGRFGSSLPLAIPDGRRPVRSLSIDEVQARPSRTNDEVRVIVYLIGRDRRGGDQDFPRDALSRLPEPILFVGDEALPRPYDYFSDRTGTKERVRVETWVPAKMLAGSTSIAFRVPLCGSDYTSRLPFSVLAPTLTRMGADGESSVFRIVNPAGGKTLSVDLDRTYRVGDGLVACDGNREFRLRVPTKLVSGYENIIVRHESDLYLLPIPREDPPKRKTTIDTSTKPLHIVKGSLGPVEWSGTGLDAVVGATLFEREARATTGKPKKKSQCSGTPAEFAVSDGGQRITVGFTEGSTEKIGKSEIEFRTAAGEVVRAPIFVTKPAGSA